MLSSFEFVDPLLAQRIRNLEIELRKLKESKQGIKNNNKLLNGTKEKLMKYQTECEQNTRRMLDQQRDKLAEYLDQQTNIITKTNRQTTYKHNSKYSTGLNQSTRIDLSIDDSKSIEINAKTQRNCKVSNFIVQQRSHPHKVKRQAKRTTVKIKNLNKKVQCQSTLIKMLVGWIKIYHERQQQYEQLLNGQTAAQQTLRRQNIQLRQRIERLQSQLSNTKKIYNNKASNILQSQYKYEELKEQNSSLMFERKSLINEVKSCKKYNKKV